MFSSNWLLPDLSPSAQGWGNPEEKGHSPTVLKANQPPSHKCLDSGKEGKGPKFTPVCSGDGGEWRWGAEQGTRDMGSEHSSCPKEVHRGELKPVHNMCNFPQEVPHD